MDTQHEQKLTTFYASQQPLTEEELEELEEQREEQCKKIVKKFKKER
jgi:chromosome segregation and condensation protein ScpB